jgi:hypothetical protein
MINDNGPVIEHSTPIAIVNQAFALFQSNIVTETQTILANYNQKTYKVEVFFGKHGFTLELNGECKIILQEGMYVDFYEVANDIRRWFVARVSTPEQLANLANYDIQSYFKNLYQDTKVKVVDNRNLDLLVIMAPNASKPEAFIIVQDYTGYKLFHPPTELTCYIGYQMITGEKPSTDVIAWMDDRLK